MHCFSFLAMRNHLGLVAWSSFVLSEKAYHRRATESTRSETLYLGVETCSQVVKVTIYSHIMAMKKVGIADLKSRLSEYLRAVRRGETIAVMDRQTPVAQIVPIRQGMVLRVREPAPGTPAPNKIPSPKPLNLNIDIVQLLLEERQRFR